MFGFVANAPIFCCLFHAFVGDELLVLPLGEANMNPKPVLLLVLLPVPACVVPFLPDEGERMELGLLA